MTLLEPRFNALFMENVMTDQLVHRFLLYDVLETNGASVLAFLAWFALVILLLFKALFS